MESPISLVLADRHRAFAEGLAVVLDGEADLQVLGTASTERRALELVAARPPALLVLDARLGTKSLPAMLDRTRERAPATRVLVLADEAGTTSASAAIAAGADGFLTKDVTGREVAQAIRAVACGKGGVFPRVRPAGRRPDPAVDLRVRSLSGTERRVLRLIVAGCSNPRIAEECGLSLSTTRAHVQRIFVKLGVHSKIAAAAFALEHRVVAVDGDPTAPPGAA